MNVLFYIDTHIIRQNPLGYWPIVSRLYKTLCSQEQYKKTNNEFNFKLLITKHPTPNQPFIATLPNKVNRELFKFNCPWDENAIEQWKLLMQGEGLISELYSEVLFYLMKKYSIDVFIYWGSNHTVKKFADSFHLYSFAMELGPTRLPFFESAYFDPLGVNGDGYSAIINPSSFATYNIDTLSYSLPFRDDYFSMAYSPILSKKAKTIYSDHLKVLIPLQLDDDSNCILHSKYNGMEDFVKDVVPRLTQKGYTVFVKPHPGAHPSLNKGGERKINVDAHQRCKEYINKEYPDSSKAVWLDDVAGEQYLSLLSKMDAVVTVNSSVAFEALLLGKIAIAMGKTPYNISGTLPTIEDLINFRIDTRKYKECAGKIANIMLNYYLYPIGILDDLAIMTQALKRGIATTDQCRMRGSEGLTHYIRNNPINSVDIPAHSHQNTHAEAGPVTETRISQQDIGAIITTASNAAGESPIDNLLNKSCPLPGNYDLIKASCTLQFNSVLDIGFGRGSASITYALYGKHVTGITLGSHCIDITKSHFNTLGIEAVDCPLLEYKPKTKFDAIWISHCLEHCNDPGTSLLKCRELLNDNGWLFIIVPPYKDRVVRGHLSVGWNIGLLMYNLICCGFNIQEGHFIQHKYNICGFVRKDAHLDFVLPMQNCTDKLVAEIMKDRVTAKNYWPTEVVEKMDEFGNFDGQFERVNWTKTLESAMRSPIEAKVDKKIVDAVLELGFVKNQIPQGNE